MEELQFTTQRGAIFARATGSLEGRRVLLLHGWLDNSNSFGPLCERLGKNLRLVAPDLPGHGRSFHIAAGYSYHLIDWVFDLESFLDELGWNECSIIAHSLGGAVAIFMGALFPNRIKSVVTLDSLGPINVECDRLVESMRDHIDQKRKMAVFPRRFISLADAVLNRQKSTETLTRARLSAPQAELLVRGSYQETPEGWVPTFDPRLKLFPTSSFTLDQILAFLSVVRCPVLLLRAQEGIDRAEYGWNERRSAIQSLTEHKIPGDHFFHLASPELVEPYLGPFL